MPRFLVTLIALCATWTRLVAGQAAQVSEPPNDYLLNLTREWSAQSVLGDLRRLPMAPGDTEIRLWGGYGLSTTMAFQLRRSHDTWSAAAIFVAPCRFTVAESTFDTMTPATIARIKAAARERCPISQSQYGANLEVDSLKIDKLSTALPLASLWRDAVAAGALTLPPKIPRKWIMADGYTYVVELRMGSVYRASVIEQTTPPETSADSQMQRVAAILTHGLSHW